MLKEGGRKMEKAEEEKKEVNKRKLGKESGDC